MFVLKALPLLAVANSVLAAPVAHEQDAQVDKRWDWTGAWSEGWSWHSPAVTVTTEVLTATAWVTAGAETWASTPAPAPTEAAPTTAPAPAPTTSAAPEYTWSPPAPAPVTTDTPPAPAPSPVEATSEAPASTWASDSSTTTATGYMATVDKWRSAFGLPSLSQDSKLEGNALKTATDSGGTLTHELNPGTLAQVLAPGTADNFESVYVGGWLCEVPSAPALAGVCATAAQGWDHSNGETGHYDILTSTSYTNIGCALADGIWACDLS